MTGLTVAAGTSTAVNGQGINVGGICPGASGTGSFRVDHCHFNNLNRNVDLQIGGWLYGVIDHCLFYGGGMAINVHHDRWGNTPQAYGDGSWAEPPRAVSDAGPAEVAGLQGLGFGRCPIWDVFCPFWDSGNV